MSTSSMLPTDLATGDELAAAGGGAAAAAGDVAAGAETTATTSSDSTSGISNADDNIDFVVQYGRVNNMTKYETVAKLENVSIPQIETSLFSNQIGICELN